MNSRKGGGRRGKSRKQDIKQFYADDLIDEKELNQALNKKKHPILDGDSDDDPQFNIDLDDQREKEQFKKRNMDQISDILIGMILKNRINPKNAFDIPLPDVKQLSLFDQAAGDNSWKKLSQTLDVGARIYGYRVDSVHNEAYKVLGGLNRTELKQAVDKEMEKDEEENTVRRQRKENMDGESTLEKNTGNIDSNHYDLEFDIDPLFQKTSAKFDEGGARGLLLNNLAIDRDLNLMLDSSKPIAQNQASQNKDHMMNNFTEKFFQAEINDIVGELFQSELCPQLSQFKTSFITKEKDLYEGVQFIEETVQNEEKDANQNNSQSDEKPRILQFENIEVDADQLLNDLGQYDAQDNFDYDPNSYQQQQLDADNDLQNPDKFDNEQNGKISQMPEFDGGIEENTNDYATNDFSKQQEKHPLNFTNIEEKFSSLGQGKSLNTFMSDHKTWMGPDAWKINKQKRVQHQSRKQNNEKKKKKDEAPKEKITVDFQMNQVENINEVFGINTSSNGQKKRNNNKSKNSSNQEDNVEKMDLQLPEMKHQYLLPVDMRIKPRRLASLFMRSLTTQKPNIGILNSTKIEANNSNIPPTKPQELKQEIEQFNAFEVASPPGGFGDDFNTFNDDVQEYDPFPSSQDQIFKNLDSIFGGDVDVQKRDRSVNIKVLKESIWGFISNKMEGVDSSKKDDLRVEEELKARIKESKKTNSLKESQANLRENSKDQKKQLCFSDICQQIPNIGLKKSKSNVTVHSCFVTLLHLANEKKLRFCKDGQDFALFKEIN